MSLNHTLATGNLGLRKEGIQGQAPSFVECMIRGENGCTFGGERINCPAVLVPMPILTIESLKERGIADMKFERTDPDYRACFMERSY